LTILLLIVVAGRCCQRPPPVVDPRRPLPVLPANRWSPVMVHALLNVSLPSFCEWPPNPQKLISPVEESFALQAVFVHVAGKKNQRRL